MSALQLGQGLTLFAGRPDSSNHAHAPDGLFMMILMHVALCSSKCNRLAYQEAHVDFVSPMSSSNVRALSFDRDCVANKHDYYVPLKWAWQTITRINCQDFASPWQAHEPRVAFLTMPRSVPTCRLRRCWRGQAGAFGCRLWK